MPFKAFMIIAMFFDFHENSFLIVDYLMAKVHHKICVQQPLNASTFLNYEIEHLLLLGAIDFIALFALTRLIRSMCSIRWDRVYK